MLAKADQARAFPKIGMSIDVDAGIQRGTEANESEQRTVSVITIEDLPAVCVWLQHTINDRNLGSPIVDIRLDVASHLAEVVQTSDDGRPIRGSKLYRCLDLLRRVRGANSVGIGGYEVPLFNDGGIAVMCQPELDAKQTMMLVGVYLNQGEKAMLEGTTRQAITKYKAALHTVRSC